MSDQLEPELERVARMLADAGPLPDAPATLRERALAIPDGGQAADAGDDGVVVPIARRALRRPRPIVLAGIAAVVAALVIVPTVVVTQRGDGSHDIALSPRAFAPTGGGKAHIVGHGDGTTTIELVVWKMPSAGSGRIYEAWLGRTGDRLALGTFHTDGTGAATVSWRVPRQEVGSYNWVWVTSEPVGGSRQPSETTALWGSLT
jgi:hypothetical protein